MLNPEKISHAHHADLSTSLSESHLPLYLEKSKKKFFSVIIHILQIIYVASEENE